MKRYFEVNLLRSWHSGNRLVPLFELASLKLFVL